MDISLYNNVINWIPEHHFMIKKYIDLSYLKKNKIKREDVFFNIINTESRRENIKNKNAIVYLIQNKEFLAKNKIGLPRENKYTNRIEMFYDSLQFLLKNRPIQETFDIHVFYENDLTYKQIEKIKFMVEQHDNIGIMIHNIEFKCPPWIIIQNVEYNIDILSKKINAWRDIGYRNMCRFYSIQIYDFLLNEGYNKMARLDDDSFIEESIPQLFDNIQEDIPYICRLFQEEDILYRNYFNTFVNIFTEKMNLKTLTDRDILSCPFNNFFVLDLSIYKNPNVQLFLFFIDCVGGIYSYRWGDAIIQNIILRLFLSRPLYQIGFRYSKWGISHENEWNYKVNESDNIREIREYFNKEYSFFSNEYIYYMTIFFSISIIFFIVFISWIIMKFYSYS